MQEKITDVKKVAEIRKSAGQSDRKITNSAQEFISTPESGTFDYIGFKEFDIPNVGKVKSVGLYLTDGNFVSENALNQQDLIKELTEIKNGNRKGKFMLKSVRLSDLSKLGASADARLVALQGKSFTTVKRDDVRVYKAEFLDSEKFDKVCLTKTAAEKADAIESALKNTEVKTGYIFSVE